MYTDIDPDDEDAVDEIYLIKTLDIMQMLTHLMEQTVDKKILKVTIHGMCKLILHGAYSTRELLSKFLLMYFNPASDAEISQILGIFLENLIKRRKQELLHDALIPTIITLLEAPYDSPLREVKLETVLKYIVEATRPIFCSNGLNLHNTLSMKFVEMMKENPDSKEILRIFSKELLQLEIGEDPLLKKDLIKQIEQVQKDSSADVRTKKYLSDFCSILNGTYRVPLKFSSTAKVQNDNEEEDEENGDENAENENENETVENEEEDQFKIPPIPELPEEEISVNNSNLQDVSISKINFKDFDINVTKMKLDPEINQTASSTINNTEGISKLQSDDDDDDEKESKKSKIIVNETLTEDTIIPETQPHAEINETNVEHDEIPATQAVDMNSTDSEEENNENITILSSDEIIPSTPDTVVKKSTRKGNRVKKMSIDSSIEEEKSEEYPATPVMNNRRLSAIKRQLDVSKSVPVTPSVSSPARKNAKRYEPTPKPTTFTNRKSSQNTETIQNTPKTPRRSQSTLISTPSRISTLPPSKASTPNTEGRMTRNLAKAEIAQNTTVTRSTSKILNVKPTIEKEAEKLKEAEKNKKLKSKLPMRKGAPVPPKIVPKTSVASTRLTRKVSTTEKLETKGTRPPWK